MDGLKAQLTALAAAQGMTLEQLRKTMTAKPEDATGDGTPPPPFVMPSPFVIRMVMFYARARQHAYNLAVLLYNVTFGFFRGYADYIDPAPALDPARLLTTLSRVNAHTIFVRRRATRRKGLDNTAKGGRHGQRGWANLSRL